METLDQNAVLPDNINPPALSEKNFDKDEKFSIISILKKDG